MAMARGNLTRRSVIGVAACTLSAGPAPAMETAPRRTTSPPGTVSIVFVGDVMLDNGPGHAVANGRDPFAACAALLLDADFTVGNLECVLGDGGEQLLKPYTFRGAAASPRLLERYFSLLGVANNHALDFGPEGLVASLAELDRAGLAHVGGGRTLAEARRPFRLVKDRFAVAVIACNAFQAERSAAAADRAGVNPLREADLLADIAAARTTADAVVVLPHWGPELVAQPTDGQRTLARRMIDAGAAAVIGAHPHVTQTVDIHRGAPIVYSLGNFVFDYYPGDPPSWTGWVVRLTFVRNAPVDLAMRAVELDAAGLPRPIVSED